MSRPALVVFDLGGVLVRWEPAAAVAAGVGPAEAERMLGSFDFDGWNRAQDAGRTFAEALEVARRDHPEWVPHLQAYVAHFEDSLVGEVDGSGALLEALAAEGVRVWALTNWASETFHHARERFGFLDAFEEILVSGDLEMAKPDPSVFAELLARADLPAERVFFVDDSPANVDAARTLGIDAVLFQGSAGLAADLRSRGLLGQACA